MRRQRIALIAIATLVVLAAAAAAAWWFREPLLALLPTPPVTVTDQDYGKSFHVIVGQRLEVRLPGNRLSGSKWQQTIELPYLRLVGDTFTEDRTPKHPGDGTEALTFQAIDAGTGPLFLSYMATNDATGYSPSSSFRIVVISQR